MMYFILYLEMSGLETTPLLAISNPSPWCSRYKRGTILGKTALLIYRLSSHA